MKCAIYTYGGHERGMGHIYQSRAIAQALSWHGAEVRFVVPDVPEGVAKLREWNLPICEISHDLTDEEKISALNRVFSAWRPHIIIVDILDTSSVLMAYMATISDVLISLDDIGEGRVWADLLVNVIHHPVRPKRANYREVNDLHYVVLRPEFERAHLEEKSIPERATKLFVSQGGSDTFGGIVVLAKALDILPEYVDIHLVLGSAFRHDESLQSVLEASNGRFVLERDVRDMAGLMLQMDVAITGGGKTLFELAALGVPMVTVTEEPREVETMDIVARHVLCENMGWRRQVEVENIAQVVESLLWNQKRRELMSLSGKEAVDGRGAWRTSQLIVNALRDKRETARGCIL